MKILERNYQHSIQSYLIHDNESEARERLRGNLLSRLSKLVNRDLNQEEISENIIPNIKIRVIRIEQLPLSEKPLFIGGLSLSSMKFETSKDPISPEMEDTFKISGIDLPTPDILNKKLDKMYSNNKFIKDTFNLTNIKVSEITKGSKVTESEFSDYSNSENIKDSLYSDSHTNHFKMIKAVSLMALHKHVTENPSSPKIRLLNGVDNLTKELTDENEKSDLKEYLITYINNPSSRSMLVKESELVIKARTDEANKFNIPTWVVMSIVSLLLLGGLAYTQRHKIANAWNFSKEVEKQSEPSFDRKKSFFRSLFSKSGRSIASNYLNDKNVNKYNKAYLEEIPILKKEAEAKVLRTDHNMKLLMEKFLGK